MRRHHDDLVFTMFLISLGLLSACLLYLDAYANGELDKRKEILVDLAKERMTDLIKKDQEAASD